MPAIFSLRPPRARSGEMPALFIVPSELSMVFVGEVAPDSKSLMERIMIRVVGWADAMDCCRCFLLLLMLADVVTNNVCDDGL